MMPADYRRNAISGIAFYFSCRLGFLLLALVPSRMAAQALDNNVDPNNLGQGDWIWEMPACETALGVATPQAVIDYEADRGMQWVTVKAGDGVNEWSQWNAAVINEAHSKGLKIFAWVYAAGNDSSYSGGATTEAQELAVAKWALSVGGDGLIIDAEGEYEGQQSTASAYASAIKAAYPTRFLSFAPLPYISLHPSYPYVQFGTNCDAVMPQDYWADLGITVNEMVNDMDGEWNTWQKGLTGSATNAIKPIIPIGQGWDSSDYTEPAADITNFVYLLKNDPIAAGKNGYHGVSYWECSQHPVAVWNGLATSSVLAGTNLLVLQDSNATFAVNLPAGGVYRYQWKFNQAVIPGATNSSYTITNAGEFDAGNYSADITNASGCQLNFSAVLSVISPLVNAVGSILAPPNLADWWPFDGNGNDIDGTITGAPQGGVYYYTNGEYGSALHFDGATGFVKTGAASLPPPWTVCLWVNRVNAPGTSAALFSDSSTNVLKLEQYNGTRKVGITVSGVADYTFNYTVPQNTWTHLAFVDNGSQVQLYANGVSQGTLPLNFPLPRAYLGLDSFSEGDAIGADASRKFTDYLLGSLDEVQLFNRALSTPEISAIYSAGSAGVVRAPEFTGVASTAGPIQLNLRGLTGKSITLFGSTNLLDWTSLGTVSNPTGAVQYLDLNASGAAQKFYRASQP